MTLAVSPSPTTTISRSRLLASAPMMSSRGLAVVLLFDVAERDMHCVSDIVAGDAVFFVVPRCAITDLHSVKIPLRRWLRQGWWCWRRSLPLRSGDASSPVSSRRIRRRFALAWISPRRGRNRGLTRKWSPEQISARLVVSHPDDPAVRVSHERIYQTCLLYTSDAADEEDSVDLGGRRI